MGGKIVVYGVNIAGFPDRLATLRVGDAISAPGAWGRSVRFGGVQFGEMMELTRDLIEETAVVIAMGRNHQTWIRAEFGREVPLFNHVCYGIDRPILDVHESIPDWREQPDQSRDYLRFVINHIWDGVPHLLDRLPAL